ncbi:MAG: 3-hydroxyacyl-CoA dehydrogenase [Burkholderiaceae bacterium]|nr:3-hydroxyacyl-CoA dehydrogenase [Burkholderiaceae bacterium]
MRQHEDYLRAAAAGATAAVVGCGAMGRGIAQLLAQAGLTVLLHDAQPHAAALARSAIEADLQKWVARGKLAPQDATAIVARLVPVAALTELAPATLVVEAVIEDLEVKRKLFAQLERIVPEHAILATNTSSLSVAAIAAACVRPQRVAGFHFFNPAPLMKLVEIVAAVQTDAAVCEALVELARRFGHTPVRAADTPGFLVNHAGRGYVTEGLKILAEGVCAPHELDAVLTDACGFRLGPCELLDLTGLDVSQPVMESIYHQYYEEPRYRPQVLTRRRMEAGLLGRKRGVGFYRYEDGVAQRPALPPAPVVPPPRVWIDPAEPALAARVREALAPGVALDTGARPAADSLIVVTPVGGDATQAAVADQLDARRTGAFDALFPGRRVRCLFATPAFDPQWREPARAAFASEGTSVLLVRDSAGLVAQRVLAMIVNIACAIAEQRIAQPDDIDRAVTLGLGYPQGPLAWGDAIGAGTVLRILRALQAATGDPRYRPAAWLARRVALALPLAHAD